MIDRTVTLQEAVRLALSNSQLLLSAAEDETIARQRVRQSEALFFPQLNLNANWSKFGVKGAAPFLVQPDLSPTLIPKDDDHNNFYSTRLDIFQPVYEGGRLQNTWRQARIAYEKAKNVREGLASQVAASAKQAFYDALLAQKRREAWDAAIEASAGWRTTGKSTALERMRAQRERLELSRLARQARLVENLAKTTFLKTLNMEQSMRFALSGELALQPRAYEVEKLLTWASRYRSELRQTEYQQESDALGISLSLAERYPRISLGATYESLGSDPKLGTYNWAGTLNIHVPLSIADMFFGWAKVRERRAQFRQATLRKADAADQVEKQVRDSFAQLGYWEAEVPARRAAVREMQELSQAVASDAQAPLSERLEARRIQTELELGYEEAAHGYLWALAALEKAVGRSLDDQR